MKGNIYFIIIIIIIIFLFTITNQYMINSFQMIRPIISNKIIFRLKTNLGLNLTYVDENFYLTDNYGYIFKGILETNGLYQLKNPTNNYNFILNYNSINTSNSSVILESGVEYNLNSNTVSNIFNKTNKKIYFDPVNKVILSNDNSGTTVYLSNLIIGSTVDWNYDFDDATIFDIDYL
jgi:hypothetical protein